MKYRSTIGGAIGDEGFEPGDLIEVPQAKEQEWLAAGLIEPVAEKRTEPKRYKPRGEDAE